MSSQTKTPSKKPKSKLFDLVMSDVRKNSHELTEFTAASRMPKSDELRIFIEDLYESGTIESEAMAVLLEGVLTERRPIFLYSGPLIKRYLKKKGIERNPDGVVSKKLTRTLCSKKAFMECLVPPVIGRQGSANLAGYYSIVRPEITSLIPWWPTRAELIAEAARIKNDQLTIGATIGVTRGLTTDSDIEDESDTEGDRDIEAVTKLEVNQSSVDRSALVAPLAVPNSPAHGKVDTFPSSSAAPNARAWDSTKLPDSLIASRDFRDDYRDYSNERTRLHSDDATAYDKALTRHFPEYSTLATTEKERSAPRAFVMWKTDSTLPPHFLDGIAQAAFERLGNVEAARLLREYFEHVKAMAKAA